MEMTARPNHGVGTLTVARSRCLRMLLLAPLWASLPALSATLGDADVRSFLSQPLDVRIAVLATRQEPVDLGCFSVRAGDRALMPLSPRRFRLDESLSERTLVIRTDDAIETPYLTMEVTLRCEGQPSPVVRTYDLAVPSLTAPAVIIQQQGVVQTLSSPSANTPVQTPLPATRSAAGVATPGQPGMRWVTGKSDTLNRIAKGIYPRSAKMRSAFIKRLREVNSTSLPGDGDALPAGLQITLPDLVALANLSPRIDPTSETSAEITSGQVARVLPRKADGEPSLPKKAVVTASSRASAAAPPAPARRNTDTSPSASLQSSARPDPGKVNQSPAPPLTAQPKVDKPTSGFSLRLSSAEMDLSRSKGVSEATRASLRDKQLLLDGDDQVAALLALRHAVKQLEGRLSDMQLKLSTATQLPATTATPAPAKPAAATAAVTSPPAAPGTAKVEPPKPLPETLAQPASVATPSAKVEAPAAKVDTPATKPEAPPAMAAAPSAPSSEPAPAPDTPFWTSTLFLGLVGAVILLLGWFGLRWARGDGAKQPVRRTTDAAPSEGRATPQPAATHTSSFLREDDKSSPVEDDLWEDLPQPANPKQPNHPTPHTPPRAEMAAVPAHDLFDGSAASLELDTRPATSVDFVLGDDFGEDKSRRQRYMEERFPELAHRSISVDEPDSIIDAARHHYEENQLQRASELLTYAFEERPGQLRFWLALFEIYRLEGRITEFGELAARFKNVHGGTDAWPKVQYIGRDLDPGQPLYSASLGRLGVPMDADFDAISENWLNVPMDFTSDVLMIELRQSLMAEHGVHVPDLSRPLLAVQE